MKNIENRKKNLNFLPKENAPEPHRFNKISPIIYLPHSIFKQTHIQLTP